MCGAIFAVGLACLASAPASVTQTGNQSVFMLPASIGFGVNAELPELFLLEAQEREATSMFDVSSSEDALFWRFDAEEAYAQWTFYDVSVVAHFDPVIAPKRNEPEKAAPTEMRVNVQPKPSSDQLASTTPRLLQGASVNLPLATSIREGSSVLAPLAFVRFCNQYASQCNFERSGITVALDSDTWKLLEDVNVDVNRSIQPVPDVYESWDLGVKRGDCDDFAVEKRRQLIARGLPAAALSLTEVVARGEGHLVLSVRTDRGTFILDNLRQSVVGWSVTGYRFVKIQSLERPSYWVAINGGDASPVQMARAALAKKDALRRNS